MNHECNTTTESAWIVCGCIVGAFATAGFLIGAAVGPVRIIVALALLMMVAATSWSGFLVGRDTGITLGARAEHRRIRAELAKRFPTIDRKA